MSLLVERVFLEIIAKPFFRRLLFPYFFLLLLVAAADANTDWNAARHQFSSFTPLAKTAILSGFISVWSVIAGHALRPVWQYPSVSFLMRQPIGSYRWAANLLPSLSIALVPVVSALWLGSYGTPLVIHYLGFSGLCLPIVLGASLRGIRAVVTAGTGVAILSLLVFAYTQHPWIGFLGLLITPPLVILTAGLVRHQVVIVSAIQRGRLSSSSVIRALIWRDLRCIVRTRKQVVTEIALLSAFSSLMMLAFRVNGEVHGREALLTAGVLFLIAVSTAYKNLEIAKTSLGKEMMRKHWPVTCEERGAALLSLIAILMAPSALPIAILGSPMGGSNLLLFLLFAMTTIAVTGALFASALSNKASSVGVFLNLIVLHGVILFVLSAWIYAITAVALAAASFLVLRGALHRFAESSEGTTVHEPS